MKLNLDIFYKMIQVDKFLKNEIKVANIYTHTFI